ncbi:potassium channel subfamily K member 13 [Macaca nemestrina]|uniref:Potassium channel subfamily K member 13 n=7 Tax=Cercopithecinae TaxID=9528 RepID=G7MYZ6_MACMU|nr:potassium channel subfamily K member 13 [Macaca mulatta]XP_003902202.1 potassium channel subfamily K member 13 [Papio anubis]XP_011715558.1 potassium channel subfamily K member 13 [Macaca nemestrina]XP_015309607.1 potassium channel subfamily K member 13 [Macaca fascicularis]XP_025248465.1 potassium channel subfamily K member 13 [Theropithecus gelada]XP_028706038.1 potassium channel subfamily K member 13 isoform X1 [Macaca mulatta]XP_045252796.1 potassium channel subfamily K member 13 [Maca
MAGRGFSWGPGHLNEDNARFLLLAALIVLYLLGGAAVFSALELAHERQAKQRWEERLANFSRGHNLSRDELRGFLRHYEEATRAGIRVDNVRPRWDFTGAFYFVGTVVSTIGFGMTTPATVGGKIFLIFYGLVGCSSTILFFNLFLERLITVIAYIMKSCHQRQLRRRGALPQESLKDAGQCEVDSLAGWKPSVYYVMLILCTASVLISCCASAMYTPIEGWSYFDSLYFCFVAFSTIGFGDLVSSQNAHYESQSLYRFANFVFILMGVCCIYSLFNVISILIKQSLNWILRKMDSGCCPQCQRGLLRSRRNVVMPGSIRNRCNISIETDGVAESDTDGRRLSGEMISMKDLLAANKASLAILQKQLSEMANGCPHQTSTLARDNEFSGGVGAFAIMNNRLAETSGDR